MHKFFKEIPHRVPTVLVYPEALYHTHENSSNGESYNAKNKWWRQPRLPDQLSDPNAFRDVVFVEWLVSQLLEHNLQLHPDRVYVGGFSSGAGLSWTLLCYRSEPFKGFAMYSLQLGSTRLKGGCGDGRLPPGNTATGYETLTGRQADLYGFKPGDGLGSPQRAPTKPVFYAHGTKDNRTLNPTGSDGCFEDGTCDEPLDDPLYSMDPESDISDSKYSVNWLVGRHQLPSRPASRRILPDENPNAGNDNVTTCAHLYLAEGSVSENTPRAAIPNLNQSAPGNSANCVELNPNLSTGTGSIVQGTGSPIFWYEMINGDHSISALSQGKGRKKSKDYDASVHAQRFFEDYADMLR